MKRKTKKSEENFAISVKFITSQRALRSDGVITLGNPVGRLKQKYSVAPELAEVPTL